MDLGRVALRGAVGPLMFGHGAQKLFGWFGGFGPEGTGGFFESLGIKPGKRQAIAAGAAEAAGGILITLGALTPVATMAVSGVMTTAIRTAHRGKGPWVTDGGWEHPAALMAITVALAETGPGRPSVDAALLPRLHGPGLALLAAAAGIAGSFAATSPQAARLLGGAAEEEPGLGVDEPQRRFTRESEQAPAGQSA